MYVVDGFSHFHMGFDVQGSSRYNQWIEGFFGDVFVIVCNGEDGVSYVKLDLKERVIRGAEDMVFGQHIN